MYLLLFTIIYIVITWVLKFNYILALAIYLIGLAFTKGFLSDKLGSVFNSGHTRDLYEKYGRKDSIIELLSLLLIFTNSYLIDYDPFTLFEFIFISFVIVLTFRFLLWGITRTIREAF